MYKRAKYGNKKVELDGYVFDSKAEAARYQDLVLTQAAGDIDLLSCQPKFVLQEGFKDRTGKHERAITYTADFEYWEGSLHVVEDVKSSFTRTEPT